jgi:O-antigen/teichoic acid export membrane protein
MIGFLPTLALRAVFFPVEPPIGGSAVDDFDNEPVNTLAVTARIERSYEILTGFVIGIGVSLVVSVAMLVFPSESMGTNPKGPLIVWEQLLAGIIAASAVCRARMYRRREQVLALAVCGVIGLVLLASAISIQAAPTTRATWLPVVLAFAALVGLCLSTVRGRRGSSEAVLPPTWARAVEVIEDVLLLAVLPVLLAILGVYGKARGLTSN